MADQTPEEQVQENAAPEEPAAPATAEADASQADAGQVAADQIDADTAQVAAGQDTAAQEPTQDPADATEPAEPAAPTAATEPGSPTEPAAPTESAAPASAGSDTIESPLSQEQLRAAFEPQESQPAPTANGEPVDADAPVARTHRPTGTGLGTGRRKEAIVRVRLVAGDGGYRLNGRSLEEYFPARAHRMLVTAPLRTAGREKDFDVVARLHGGGVSGQAGALQLGIARALLEIDESLRPALKAEGMLTRDAREKERRKYGLKKARKAPQYSKR